MLVLWLNNALYGSPFRTGYGQLGHLFGLSAVPVNASRYFGWLVETHTPFPLLAFAAPFVVAREKRADAALAIGLILATCFIYFLYTPFDDWSYLRFLLPAIALMLVLASAVTCVMRSVTHAAFSPAARRSRRRIVIVAVITAALALFCVRTADDRLAFNLKFLEQRYRSAGIVVRDRLPENAVVLSVWDSGAVRFHGRKEALIWAGLDPAWLDRSLSWLDEHGRTPYILRRVVGRAGVPEPVRESQRHRQARLAAEVRDRPRRPHLRSEGSREIRSRRECDTEYLWPMRD